MSAAIDGVDYEEPMGHVTQPVFVKLFRGFNTGGQPMYWTICVCKDCQGLTAPMHVPTTANPSNARCEYFPFLEP